MPYTKTDYPDAIKNLKEGARNKWIEVFNAVFDEKGDEDTARMAAWKVVKDKYGKDYMKESITFEEVIREQLRKIK